MAEIQKSAVVYTLTLSQDELDVLEAVLDYPDHGTVTEDFNMRNRVAELADLLDDASCSPEGVSATWLGPNVRPSREPESIDMVWRKK